MAKKLIAPELPQVDTNGIPFDANLTLPEDDLMLPEEAKQTKQTTEELLRNSKIIDDGNGNQHIELADGSTIHPPKMSNAEKATLAGMGVAGIAGANAILKPAATHAAFDSAVDLAGQGIGNYTSNANALAGSVASNIPAIVGAGAVGLGGYNTYKDLTGPTMKGPLSKDPLTLAGQLQVVLNKDKISNTENPNKSSVPQYTNYPNTAALVGTDVTNNMLQNNLPGAAVNLEGTISSALTGKPSTYVPTNQGGILGKVGNFIGSAVKPITDTADAALGGIQTAVKPIVDNKVFDVLRDALGLTAYGAGADFIAENVLGDKPRVNKDATDATYQDWKHRDDKDTEYLKLQATQAAKTASPNFGSLDPKSKTFNDFNDLLDVKAIIKKRKDEVGVAIKNNDVNAIQLLGNQIAAIASIANKQGVVNGEEVDRVLSSIQAAKSQIEKGQWTGDNGIKLGRELWGGLNTFADIVESGATAKIIRYRDTYGIPNETFTKSGINLDTPKSNPQDIITPQRLDLATARATVFDNVKQVLNTGGTIKDSLITAFNSLVDEKDRISAKPTKKEVERAINNYYAIEDKKYNDALKAIEPETKVKEVKKEKPAAPKNPKVKKFD